LCLTATIRPNHHQHQVPVQKPILEVQYKSFIFHSLPVPHNSLIDLAGENTTSKPPFFIRLLQTGLSLSLFSFKCSLQFPTCLSPTPILLSFQRNQSPNKKMSTQRIAPRTSKRFAYSSGRDIPLVHVHSCYPTMFTPHPGIMCAPGIDSRAWEKGSSSSNHFSG
jgi:hypothetical protein